MSQQQSKDNTYQGASALIILIALLMYVPFLSHFGYLNDTIEKNGLISKLIKPQYSLGLRLLYILAVAMVMGLYSSSKIHKRIKKEDQPKFRRIYFFLSIFILVGTLQYDLLFYYNIILFPALVLYHLNIGSKAWAKIGDRLDSENPLAVNPQGKLRELSLVYQTNKGPLHVHNVFQGILVQGGAGAGKSASIIEPAIKQWVEQGSAMLIYDWKGAPTPTLGTLAYNAWLNTKPAVDPKTRINNAIKPTFHLLSFNQLSISVRPNPINPVYLDNPSKTRTVVMALLFSINPDWSTKKDFWINSAINLTLSLVERLRKDPDIHEFCTIPHVVYLILQEPSALINFIRQDLEGEALIRSFISADDKGADEQLAGMLSTLQSAITVLLSEDVFWLYGAPLKDQFNLDLNNPLKPKILSMSNDNTQADGITPLLAATSKSVFAICNTQGKHPMPTVFDELPTMFMKDIAQIPATGRSNKICFVAGIQDMSQLTNQYAKEADTIPANLGTHFIGMTNNGQTAKRYSDMFGTYKKADVSHSVSDSSLSSSERLNNEKIMQEKDFANQPVGHFSGKVADGNPAFFSCQFNEFVYKDHFPNWKDKIDLPSNDVHFNTVKQIDPILAEKLFSQMKTINYKRIMLEVNALLKPYQKI